MHPGARWARHARLGAYGTLVAVVAAGIALAIVSLGQPGTASTTTTTTTSTTIPPPTTTTTTVPPLVPPGTYPIGSTTLQVVDNSVAGDPGRQVPTTVWYPATAAAGAAGATQPDHRDAPYPLLVFSQGYEEYPTAYMPLLQAWASAGFVVAAPSYPDTDPPATPKTPAPDRADIVHHPTDLKTVLAAVLGASSGRGTTLSGLVDPYEIGLVGQSDGGDVSLAVGADTCCRYPGVGALAILSGAEYAGFQGPYFATPTPPLLVVQGSADVINPPGCSVQIYDAAPAPKYYLDLVGADHLAPYTSVDPYETVVAHVTTDFFEAELEGRTVALGAMAGAANNPPLSALTVGGTAPPATPGCPTAPPS